MLRLLLALVLVVMVMGEGCCPPNTWEGFVGTVTGWVKDRVPHLTKSFLKYHVNSTLGMVEMEGDVIEDGWHIKIKIIKDNNENVEYIIMNGACIKRALVAKTLNCIPENADLVLNTYFGSGSEMLAVKVYRFMVGDQEVFSTVTSSGCIPVEDVTTGTRSDLKVEFVGVVQVSGLTVGVKDPSVFYIPSICASADISSGYVPVMSRWMPSVFH